MAGGTFQSHNKVLPGVYINIKSAPTPLYSVGDRGTVAVCEALSWGPVGKVLTLRAGEDVSGLLGYDVNSAPELEFLRQLFLGCDRTPGAKTVLLYRPAAAEAVKATATLASGDAALSVTAVWPGVRGNTITLASASLPDGGGFRVTTAVDGKTVDEQFVTDWEQLKPNTWAEFRGVGTPAAVTATALSGGADGTVSAPAYSGFLTAVEPYRFDVLCYSGADETVKAACAAFVKRLSEDEGRKCQAVLAGHGADYEGVISVENGLVLKEKTLTPGQTAWWVAGCTAGAGYNKSLTAAKHPLAVDAAPKLTSAQTAAAVSSGGFVLSEEDGEVRVVTDVNSLVSLSAEKGRHFCKNRVIRVLYTITNSIYQTFARYHLGKTDNNTAGRDLLKKEVVGMLNEMQANGGVQNFVADDVTVSPGGDADAVVVELAVQPVDAVEKIYMTVTVS